MKTKLTETQIQNLSDIAAGYSCGENYASCESLERRGLVRGDWVTGYYVTPKGISRLAIEEDR